MKKGNINKSILNITFIAVLTAIILLMAFTPVGYIKTAGLEITLITVPVIVGAIVLGPGAGAILGAVFGITSFLQAALGLSPFGLTLFGINPFFCFLVCIPTRTLMGFLTGVIFKLFKNKNFLSYSVTGLCGALLNTVLFMSTLVACFWNTDFIQGLAGQLGTAGILAFVIAFVGLQGLIEAIACFVLASAIGLALDKYLKRL